MAEGQRVVIGFQTGEVSPSYAARQDVEKLFTACRAVQNMTLQVYGGASRRNGTQFIALTKESEPGTP